MILNNEVGREWPALSDSEREEITQAWLDEPPTAPLKTVERLLGEISQDVYAASWLDGIDQFVWRLLHDPSERRRFVGQDHLGCTGSELDDKLITVDELTVRQGWFPIYDVTHPIGQAHGRRALLDEAGKAFDVTRK